MKFLLLLALSAFVLVQLSSANKRPTKKPNNVALEPVPQNMTNATVLTLLNEKATQDFIIRIDKRYKPAVPVQLLWFKYHIYRPHGHHHHHHAKLLVVYDMKCDGGPAGLCTKSFIKFTFHGNHHKVRRFRGIFNPNHHHHHHNRTTKHPKV